ncbi:hypothetical protein POM88_002582 [Heracleum sosnowskyi]|uniref:J domain-containing protein n=1 Tax=Heracleum sosnowskyi TaxID=360622 RepID=A0AAD8NBF7_9APIA|nr:hypothetical protein POM88_002582 [Heracleum sosnowskyi]
MECNREEAIKVREFAEMKLQNGDFQGAQKLALKASKLFPGPDENISQVLIVCDILCAVQNNNIASEKDWYGILQTGGIVDESTIMRQYRKLALLLHPDKNKFSGAEAAFKLIGEANTFLLEHEKKSLYDRRYRAFKKKLVPQSPARQVYQSDRNSDGSETFWTICSSCDIKFKYFRAIENKRMRCPVYKQEYVAYDLNAQSAGQSSQSTDVASEGLAPASSSSESERICSVKGKRKVQTEKQDEKVIYEESVQTAPKENTNNQNISSCRRSSRQKLNVSYNEDKIVDDFPDFAQRSVGSKSGSCREDKEKHEKIDVSPKASSVPDDAESAPKLDTFLIPEIYKCRDPEFSYFDINKDEETFCVNQIWAFYDSDSVLTQIYAGFQMMCYYEKEVTGQISAPNYAQENAMRCHQHLKVVEYLGYHGCASAAELAICLARHAPILQRFIFELWKFPFKCSSSHSTALVTCNSVLL